MNLSSIKNITGYIVPSLVVAIISFILYKQGKKILDNYRNRQVGTKAGASNFSNLAYELYQAGTSASTSDNEAIAEKILGLSDEELFELNSRFKKLYGRKCEGGGLFCNDTTSIRTFTDIWCLIGCENINKLQERLVKLGL